MGTIRPLFLEIPRLEFDLPKGWQNHFVNSEIGDIRIEQGLPHIENWLRCYVDMRHIASFSASHRHIIRALRRLDSRARKLQLGYSRAREKSFRSALEYIPSPNDETDRARNIVLDYLGNALLCDKDDRITLPLSERGIRAHRLLASVEIGTENIRRMRHHLRLISILLTGTPEENQARFRLLSSVIGRPLYHQADRHMASYFSPDQDAVDTLATAMCVTYRFIGGNASIRRDGYENNFMKFLNSASLSLQGHHAPNLISAANRMLEHEKLNGEGSLEEILRLQCPATVGAT